MKDMMARERWHTKDLLLLNRDKLIISQKMYNISQKVAITDEKTFVS